ncbi:hypothetical protein [Streptomyces brevispora]|uniref:Uncharacterized protein n=1 Tax=Streptomyces brevispora TaxID=887462 RepID=A0ABZ1FW23_9ACTN|nr:hypothetical protein [Streptomyces brevispora]WSC11700.1 hypothetical protein OIE64_01640 [Streptomyces brevispora]
MGLKTGGALVADRGNGADSADESVGPELPAASVQSAFVKVQNGRPWPM